MRLTRLRLLVGGSIVIHNSQQYEASPTATATTPPLETATRQRQVRPPSPRRKPIQPPQPPQRLSPPQRQPPAQPRKRQRKHPCPRRQRQLPVRQRRQQPSRQQPQKHPYQLQLQLKLCVLGKTCPSTPNPLAKVNIVWLTTSQQSQTLLYGGNAFGWPYQAETWTFDGQNLAPK